MNQRIRIHYSKNEILRYTSTLDMQKLWERILRRARMPVLYSKGFHPQPKIQLACPLPLGLTSKAEIVDFWLETEFNTDLLLKKLHDVLNPGIIITHIESVPINDPALQTRLNSSLYLAELKKNINYDEIAQNITSVFDAVEIIRTRRNKQYDLRPLVESLELQLNHESGNPVIWMNLSIKSGGPHGRPDEVLDELGIDPLQARIQRMQLVFAHQD